VDHRLARVAGKSEDVSAVGDDAGLLPCEQHLTIVGDLVLPLLRTEKAVRIDVLQSDENAFHSCPFALLDEAGKLVTQGVNLNE
jgi:hypothetical protein